MPSKRTNKRKRYKIKLPQLPINMPLALQNNYTNQQIIMLIILAECYMHYLEYCKIRGDGIKNKLQTQTIKPPINQNASFSDTTVDSKLTHDGGFAEDHYGVSLAYYYNGVVEKAGNKPCYNIKANQQNVGSNFQVPIQVGSFCFVP